ncbi:hypothetical protein [Maricaulis sp.]|uniref:hypothetical protein n=1 Tax=Maricaulis sp. TaxID=1486257 RepID=UPI002B2717B9|nr:hypothetical protein [Maricaulis sp.]
MRTLVCVLALSCLTAGSLAQPDPAFQAEFRSEATGSIEIGRIGFSELVRTKADSLGEAELARLSGYLRSDLERSLISANWHGVAVRETVLDITILDVVPNRPTMQQIQELDTAHYSAHANGGAALSARLVNADGSVIAEFRYDWFNPDPGSGAAAGVWTDTRLAFQGFAESIADSLGVAPGPHS